MTMTMTMAMTMITMLPRGFNGVPCQQQHHLVRPLRATMAFVQMRGILTGRATRQATIERCKQLHEQALSNSFMNKEANQPLASFFYTVLPSWSGQFSSHLLFPLVHYTNTLTHHTRLFHFLSSDLSVTRAGIGSHRLESANNEHFRAV